MTRTPGEETMAELEADLDVLMSSGDLVIRSTAATIRDTLLLLKIDQDIPMEIEVSRTFRGQIEDLMESCEHWLANDIAVQIERRHALPEQNDKQCA